MAETFAIYIILLFSIVTAWVAIWNHYNSILTVKNIQPPKWRGDDRTFLSAALIAFLIFSAFYFLR